MSIESTEAAMESYWNEGNMEVVAEEAVYTLMESGEQYVGREAIAGLMKSFYTESFDADFFKTTQIITEGQVALEGKLRGTHIGEFAGVPATGKDVMVPMSIFYDVRDNQIQLARIYILTTSFLEQVG